MPSTNDLRFRPPLYTMSECAAFLGVPRSTFATWARGYERERRDLGERVKYPPVITAHADGRGPRVPFIGFAEGMVVAAFRKTGVSLQHIRAALPVLSEEIGVDHALASKRLYTDGAQILYDLALHREPSEELSHLVVVVSGQRVFGPIIRDYLRRIKYGPDGWAARVVLPITESPLLIVDPKRAFGQPIFTSSGARMRDVLERWRAGEPMRTVARDYGVPQKDVEAVIRATFQRAA